MTLWQILSHGERMIVWQDEGCKLLYTWNQSLTLQTWLEVGVGRYEEVGIRTLGTEPSSYHTARQRAKEWANE